ncbi:MAG: hypothetical protein JW837_00530 [Sedimentisphaerales bacterium]|nr:hypothetical protein [Sedimentisphaerales bacterium]
MHYAAKHQHFCAGRIMKYLPICLLLVMLFIAGCDEDSNSASYSNGTDTSMTSSSDTNTSGGDDVFVNPCPPAVILGGIGLAYAGWKLRKNKKS